LPAGKIEYGEAFRTGAVREAKEEAGVVIAEHNLKFVHVVHRHSEEGGSFMDWVDVYFEAASWEGEPFNAEEEKSEKLEWLDLDDLPSNVVPPQASALKRIVQGVTYSEYGWKNETENA
jgi:8-oxo-dGTP diphosphatase